MAGSTSRTCPDDLLSRTVAGFGSDPTRDIARVETLLVVYPADARLQFLYGSLLAGVQRYPEARLALGAAVATAPDYALARFQLGFLELTSGEATQAIETWRPLMSLEIDDPLRLFAQGLEHLIADRFEDATALLEQGIALNPDIAPLNHDMRLIIQKVRSLPTSEPSPSEPLSATQLLFRKYGGDGRTKH